MATRVKKVGGPDPKKPFHVIYGRNRWSKNLRSFGHVYRNLDEARKDVKELRELQGHDYSFSISSSWEKPPGLAL